MAPIVWVLDTSSLIAIKSTVPRVNRERLFEAMTTLAHSAELCFPREVLAELRRNLEDKRQPDPPSQWAISVEAEACSVAPTFDDVKAVLAMVPDVLDPDKESGVDEADPYVLALAVKLRAEGYDARVVTQEARDAPKKLSLNTACGMLGVPSVPLGGFLRALDRK
ncbi:MAG TPA: DUF4411 family protein [Vicinamibacterales bacterium]|nr:DUF4411 family protein [Vicinamibacterales bacterium]